MKPTWHAPLNSLPIPETLEIEVAISLNLPVLQVIGLPEPEVAEARERIRAAIESSGLEFPRRRVVLNLSPAQIRKKGTGLDLPMALALLCTSEDSKALHQAMGERGWDRLMAWGELGLSGAIRSSGQIYRTMYSAWHSGCHAIFLSKSDESLAREALRFLNETRTLDHPPPRIIAIRDLKEAWDILTGSLPLPKEIQLAPIPVQTSRAESPLMSLSPRLERIIGLAAAGAHHLFLFGPRGSGKTQALEWISHLIPRPAPHLELDRRLMSELRDPFHLYSRAYPSFTRRIGQGARAAALLGSAGSSSLQPGEFALAHGGLLIADEFPEWGRDCRELLREPLESGHLTLTRKNGSWIFPAKFQFAASGNLCPCGGWPEEDLGFVLEESENLGPMRPTPCTCRPETKQRYLDRLSGPVLDRIDLCVRVIPQLEPFSASSHALPNLRERVSKLREMAMQSLGNLPGRLEPSLLEEMIQENPEWKSHLNDAGLSSLRSRHKALRVALSIALWDGAPTPNARHFLEASLYRPERFLLGTTAAHASKL